MPRPAASDARRARPRASQPPDASTSGPATSAGRCAERSRSASAAICAGSGCARPLDGAARLEREVARLDLAPASRPSGSRRTPGRPAAGSRSAIACASAYGTSCARVGSLLHLTYGLGTSIASRLVRFAFIDTSARVCWPAVTSSGALLAFALNSAPTPLPTPGRRVEVDVGDRAAGLRVAVRHADGDRLLQPEHVAEVLGERAEHRQLGRARGCRRSSSSRARGRDRSWLHGQSSSGGALLGVRGRCRDPRMPEAAGARGSSQMRNGPRKSSAPSVEVHHGRRLMLSMMSTPGQLQRRGD